MKWTIAEAAQQFPDLLQAAMEEPQSIYNQQQQVAVVVEVELFQEFLHWRQQQQLTSLADTFTNLRHLCAEEDYSLELPARQNRPNLFVHDLGEIPL